MDEREADHSATSTTTVAEAGASRPVNRLALTLAIAAIALAIGSLTPWVTIFGLGISGVSIQYGYVSLVAAGMAGVLAYLTTRQTTSRVIRWCAAGVTLGAVLSVASAVYVGWAIRSSFGGNDGATDEFSRSVAEAFRLGLGVGIWLVIAGGALAVVVALPMAAAKTLSRRAMVATLIALAVLGTGGAVAADQKAKADDRRQVAAAKADERRQVAAAKAKDAADAKAEQERERAEAQAEREEAQAEAAAEAAEVEDQQRYTVKITSCVPDEYFGITAKGTIQNDSAKPRSYTVTVDLLDKNGGKVDTATDYVREVAPGDSTDWDAMGFTEAASRCGTPSVEPSEF